MFSRNSIQQRWTEDSVPDCAGRVAVVTGANSGIGFHTARVLAQRGATVVLACRSSDKGEAAADRIRATAADADLSVIRMDLLSLASIREAAAEIGAAHPRIDVLFNNAGTTFEHRTESADGFEATFATNHLGHYALTGLLLDRLAWVPESRVVSVSSLTYKLGPLDFDDLHAERGRYRNMRVYGRSKLANLLFTSELQRRLAEARLATIATAAHPGSAHTSFGDHMGPLSQKMNSGPLRPLVGWIQQPAQMGALPSLRAGLDPVVRGGECYGPDGRGGFKGHPVLTDITALGRDPEAARRLWSESERLTGIVYDFAVGSGPEAGAESAVAQESASAPE